MALSSFFWCYAVNLLLTKKDSELKCTEYELMNYGIEMWCVLGCPNAHFLISFEGNEMFCAWSESKKLMIRCLIA